MSMRTKQIILCAMVMCMMSMKAQAQAYGAQWGIGMYGGDNACGYQIDVGDAATSIKDQVDDETEKLKKMQEDLTKAQRKQRDLKRQVTKDQNDFNRSGFNKDSAVYALVQDHVESGRPCSAYQTSSDVAAIKNFNNRARAIAATPAPAATAGSTTPAPAQTNEFQAANDAANQKVPLPDNTFDADAWANICSPNPPDATAISGAQLCSHQLANQNGFDFKPGNANCVKSVTSWQKDYKDQKKEDDIVAALKAQIREEKKNIADLKKDFVQSAKDYMADQQQEATEGGCYECMIAGNGAVYKPYKPSALQIGGEVALGIGAMYLGNQMYKDVSSNNAKLGFPTAPVNSFGFGFPYFAGALYGAIGGGGMAGGSFGCSGGMSGGMQSGPYGMMGPWGQGGMYGPQGGPFGYPAGMYPSPYGGGMFNPGMGPWGMNGPWGLGEPGMGMGMGAGMGMGMMSPYGMPGMGMMASAGMMSPYGMGAGMMSPYGMPGMGMMASAGMMSPYGMPGMDGGMGMMSPYGMGMMASAGMMSPYGMGNQYALQMQQMQMQMAQAQAYQQYQQRQAENYMAGQQVMSGLYSQMNQLMMQIQQVQMQMATGGSVGGYYMGPYSSGSVGYGTTGGTSVLPGVTNAPGLNTGGAPSVR